MTNMTRSLLCMITLVIIGSALAPVTADAQYRHHHRRHHHHYHRR